MTGGPLRRAARRVWKERAGRWLLLALGVLLITSSVVPVPYRIGCQAELQPTNLRYAVAPYEGILQEVLVRPGDVVRAGQTVARMDDRELRYELAGLIAERDLAVKKRDVSRSAHDASATQMAELEIEKLQLKINLLRYRQDNLEIKSAVQGVVIGGDLKDAQGAPVKTGDALLEIAPLSQFRLELDVAENDLPQVTEGLPVRILLDGRPNMPLTHPIERVRPQSEIRDGSNVFVAEVPVSNVDGQLRPGMRGRAKILVGKRSLIWIGFHHAWQKIVQLMS
jgi:multidrug efflux pump subunit AcrA (membrane-fusion protein)